VRHPRCVEPQTGVAARNHKQQLVNPIISGTIYGLVT